MRPSITFLEPPAANSILGAIHILHMVRSLPVLGSPAHVKARGLLLEVWGEGVCGRIPLIQHLRDCLPANSLPPSPPDSCDS